MSFVHLFYDRGWDFYWDPASGKMYAKQPSMFLGKTHDFSERTRDRASAIAVAKAWLHG